MNDLFTEGGASLSDDGLYRYRLWRKWEPSRWSMTWIMLNPSTADASVDDPTIRKCAGFARARGYGGIVVVNLFALRTTDPSELQRASDPVGPENDEHVRWAIDQASEAVHAGWGAHRFASARAHDVMKLAAAAKREVRCFAKSKDGHPCHPLYLPYASSEVTL